MTPVTPILTPAAAIPTISPNTISFDSAKSRPSSGTFTPPQHDDRTLSNETSLLEDEDLPPSQYNLTQEFNEFRQEPSFTKSREAMEGTIQSPQILLHELVSSGPSRRLPASDELSRDVPFRLRYECHRLARKASLSARQFFGEVSTMCKTEQPAFAAFWDAAKAVCKNAVPAQNLQASDKSSLAAWESAAGNFTTESNKKSVVLSGTLNWAEAPQKGLFDLKLKPLQLEKSCRFERRFGGDRLLCLTMPDLSRDMPQHHKLKADSISSAVSQWLGSETHYIAGRHWRAFYMENAERKRNKTTMAGFKIFLFAVGGVDISLPTSPQGYLGGRRSESRTTISLKEFIDWYMPIKSNIGSKDKKFFQRQKLGLSRSFATVILDQSEFVDLEDDPSWTEPMNDGCARMSRKLASKVSEYLGLDHTPSVFQGRISGAKGLWMVENDITLHPDASKQRGFWLEVSTSSQLKVLPHPKDRLNADPEQRTFEVLAWSKPPRTSVMTKQLISILHHGGVKKEQLEERLRANTHGYWTDLLIAMKDPRHLRLWTRQHENVDREKGTVMLGSFPNDRAEQINFLLESGFLPGDNEIIVSRIRNFLASYLEDYVDRLHLKIDMATSVWCVPDPYGILEKDEIQLNFSQPWVCPDGQLLTTLWDLECLVFRSPGYLPSDVQRVKAVFRPELSHLLDVVIFPTKGEKPLASKLSGGDYDGDKCWVCFDQSIVNSFENTLVPSKPPGEAECGLVNKSQKLADIFTSSGPKSSEVDAFLAQSFSFNLQKPMLGECSVQHEMLAYHRPLGLADPGALKLAALVGFLVDAPKQGYFLSEEAWKSLRSKTSGKTQFCKPAYKSTSQTKPNLQNIVDYLKFVVATDEKMKILSEFQKIWPEGSRYDTTLSAPFNNALERYGTNMGGKDKAKEAETGIGRNILRKLREDIDSIKAGFQPELARHKDNDERYENLVWAMHERLQSIEPLGDQDHEICRRFEDEKDEQFSSWSRLRASCFYLRWNKGLSPWYAAGTDLAKIKADAAGPLRFMTASMHHIMKPHSKLVMRVTERAREDEEEASFDQWDDE